tara:strand:- start:4114 stop:4416 length:303 start_codon:yes stop_codon:yes gene_type:complete
MDREIKFYTLTEQHQSYAKTNVPVAVEFTHGGIYIELDGYAKNHADPDAEFGTAEKCVIHLNVFAGEPEIRLYTDINEQDETHQISFLKARNERRIPTIN